MQYNEFRKWLLAQGFSLITINKTLRYIQYLENKLNINFDEIENIEEIVERFIIFREKGLPLKTLNNWVKYINRYITFRGIEPKLKYYREYSDDYLKIPSDEDVKKILSVRWARPDVDLRNRSMLFVLFSTGIRIGELIALNWNDLDLKDYLLIIRRGKFEKQRVIPIPPKVVKLLLEYKKYRIASDPNAIFTTIQGRITYSYARNVIKEAGKKAGIPWFHAHAARHWRAIKWLEQGINIETIRRLLGHTSLKTTQRYLRALSLKFSIEEVMKKDHFFGPWPNLGPSIKRPKGGDFENDME